SRSAAAAASTDCWPRSTGPTRSRSTAAPRFAATPGSACCGSPGRFARTVDHTVEREREAGDDPERLVQRDREEAHRDRQAEKREHERCRDDPRRVVLQGAGAGEDAPE